MGQARGFLPSGAESRRAVSDSAPLHVDSIGTCSARGIQTEIFGLAKQQINQKTQILELSSSNDGAGTIRVSVSMESCGTWKPKVRHVKRHLSPEAARLESL